MNKEISVKFHDASGKDWTFTNLDSLLKFLKDEEEFWSRVRNELPSDQRTNIDALMNAGNSLKSLVTTISGWEEGIESWDDAQLKQNINSLQQPLNKLRQNWLWSCHEYTPLYVESHNEYGKAAAESFKNIVLSNQVSNLTNDGFFGAMIGYEFLHQESDIVQRSNSEEASLSELRDRLDNRCIELTERVNTFEKNFTDWETATKTSWDEWTGNSETEYGDKQGAFKQEFDGYMESCRTEIEDLRRTYEEKLRLEKPAEYWNRTAKKMSIQGYCWSALLVLLVAVGFIYFLDYFDSWLYGKELEISLNTLQGLLIFGTAVAAFAFLVKTIARLAFSSFHLMRDAEEREQLTYLYLSLSHEGAIDETSRDIVLQALFSRSETGLISGDSSPTMPNIGDVIRASSRVKTE